MGQQVSALFWACRAGVRIYLGSSLAFFPLPLFLICTFFFRFSDLVICGFLVWSHSVRTSAAVAAAVCCHGFLKVGLSEAANNHYETKWVSR